MLLIPLYPGRSFSCSWYNTGMARVWNCLQHKFLCCDPHASKSNSSLQFIICNCFNYVCSTPEVENEMACQTTFSRCHKPNCFCYPTEPKYLIMIFCGILTLNFCLCLKKMFQPWCVCITYIQLKHFKTKLAQGKCRSDNLYFSWTDTKDWQKHSNYGTHWERNFLIAGGGVMLEGTK